MPLSDNRRLFDLATRLAVYVESVKVYQAREFNLVLRKVDRELSKLLARVNYRTLDGLSKAQLTKLVRELHKSQYKIYSAFTRKLTTQLKEFMEANLEVNKRVWATHILEERKKSPQANVVSKERAAKLLKEEEEKSDNLLLFGTLAGNKLWSRITNMPIPANGLYLLPFIQMFANSAQGAVESTIRKAWANKWTFDEMVSAITGDVTERKGTASNFRKTSVQAAAVIHTAFSHVAALSAAAVMSAAFTKYQWCSVMDERTTDICRSRNLNVYKFGEGPLPPAHIRCRSHIVPVTTKGFVLGESFRSWLAQQPDDDMGDPLDNYNFRSKINNIFYRG